MSGISKFKRIYSEEVVNYTSNKEMEESVKIRRGILRGSQSQIKKSSGASALTPDAAAQLGPKAVELQRTKAKQVDVPLFVNRKNKLNEFLGTGRVVAAKSQTSAGDRFTQVGTVQKVLGVKVPGSFQQGSSASDVQRHNQKSSSNTQIKPNKVSTDQLLGKKTGGQYTTGITPDKTPPTPTSTTSSTPKPTPSQALETGLKGVPILGNVARNANKMDKRYREVERQYNSYEPEGEVVESHWDPATKTIGDKKRTGTDPEIQAMAAKAAASGPKKRKPIGSVRKNSATFTPSSPEQAKADKKSWDNYWEGSWKNNKMNEKIDVGADAGTTISDFVHSKSKTFKGDSKKQRIKRALGAYYAAQKEETEIIYDYVIEALVDAEFAQDYETAENMFECMSDEFVAVILEEYIEEKARGTRPKKTVHAYDVDETIFSHGKKGKPNVQVHVNDASGKRVKSLSNQDFNTHKLDKGHSYDFSEFKSASKFKETSRPNKKVIKDIKRKQARGQNVHIITARSKFDNPSEFQGHLKKHGVDVPMNKIHYTGGMKGSDIGKKKVDVAKGIAKQSGAKTTHMYDDAAKVHKAFEKEKQNKPTSTKIKTHLAKPNKSGETQLRSYQATKEEMSSYDYWKQFID